MSEIKRLEIAGFRAGGYLQEVNRQFLHPLGLALEVAIEADGTERLSGIWDCRNDPAGIVFDEAELGERERGLAESIERERATKAATRQAMLGYVIQPLS